MTDAGTVPADVAGQLPSVEGSYFPTIADIDAAKTVITEGWPTVVGVTVETVAS